MPGIIVDIGTGDGAFAYELAKRNPDRFIIAIDPAQKGMEEVSAKVAKKSARGGLKNALFVLADVVHLPEELDGMANQVFINFPWSGLLRGVVLAEEATWSNVRRICKPGAFVDVVFGYAADSDPGKTSELDLPELDERYVVGEMLPKLKALGFTAVDVREVEPQDLESHPSTWAKKLRFGKARTYFYLRLRRE